MYIILLVHLFLAQFLPSNQAFFPLDTEGYCSITKDSNHDNNVPYLLYIFAENCEDSDHNDSNEVSNPLEHSYYSPNIMITSPSLSEIKTFCVFFKTSSFPQQKLFLLYQQLKLNCWFFLFSLPQTRFIFKQGLKILYLFLDVNVTNDTNLLFVFCIFIMYKIYYFNA